MSYIKIRNLDSADDSNIVSGNYIPVALNPDEGQYELTQKATFGQVVSGGITGYVGDIYSGNFTGLSVQGCDALHECMIGLNSDLELQSEMIHISAGAVTSETIAAGAVTANAIAAGAVTANAIAAGAVTTNAIAPGAVTAVNIAPNSITADNMSPGATTTVTAETLLDSDGVQRTINSSAGGFLALRVNGGGTNADDGPNPRTVGHNSITGANISSPNHGLKTGAKIRFSGDLTVEMSAGTIYTVTWVDNNTISINGITSYTIFAGAEFIISRELFTAFNAVDFKEASSDFYVACVNFEFSSFDQAYRWFVRYGQGSSKLILLAGSRNDSSCNWSATTPINSGFNIGGGVNFEYLTQFQIWGNLVDVGGTKLYGLQTVGGNPGLASYTRSRITFEIKSASDGLPLWFRIFGSMYFKNITIDYKIATGTTVSLATGMRCSHGLFSLVNVGMVVWSTNAHNTDANWRGSNSSNTTGFVALEGGQIYVLGQQNAASIPTVGLVQYGFQSIGICSSIGPSKIVIGTPEKVRTIIRGIATPGGALGLFLQKNVNELQSQTLTINSTISNNCDTPVVGFGVAQKPGIVAPA